MFGDMSHESWDSSVDSEQCNGEMNSITDADDSYHILMQLLAAFLSCKNCLIA